MRLIGTTTSRRGFLKAGAVGAVALASSRGWTAEARRPNMIFVMCDDLGYGDVGFNGNSVIRTPCLDRMRREGVCFTRFHTGGPVCSPTRGTCMTGRHYMRYGIGHANEGALPRQEITIAEIAKQSGYRTGHFGKWHLGTLSKTEKDGNRGGPQSPALYSPPWEHGFDVCFCTESKVPTWDPGKTPAEDNDPWGTPGTPWGTSYWNERGERVRENLEGDDARVILDRVEPFVRSAAAAKQPFLAVVWFHTPHAPVVAGPAYRAMYADAPESKQHYFGCISAMDEQVGRLNALLAELGIEQDTAVWFCSDNGPEGRGDGSLRSRNQGSTGGLRGRKRSLYNGGITVPALLKWPSRAAAGATCETPCSTLDCLPTVAEILEFQMPDRRPLDGTSLMPLIGEQKAERPAPIPFRYLDRKDSMFGAPTFAMIDNRFKLLTNLSDDTAEDECYDMTSDPFEEHNIIGQQADFAASMRKRLREFVDSCRHSHNGGDYAEPYTPLTRFPEPRGDWSKL